MRRLVLRTVLFSVHAQHGSRARQAALWGQVRSIPGAVCVALLLTAGSAVAQGRYVRAEENQNHDLVITTSGGERIVVGKSDRKWADERQTEFKDIAISRDGVAVGWVAYYPNCCTSYPIPILVEVYTAGRRQTFQPAIGPWQWCFVDGSATVAAISTTVHGPQNEVIERWDISTGTKRGEFTWMDGETYPGAPAWVVAVRSARASKTHECSTK
jgi:hypothetical protein